MAIRSDSDLVWRALADPTRRGIVEALAGRGMTTGELVARYSGDLVRTAVMRHLDVLEEAGLVRVEREGRTRWNYLERKPAREVASWLGRRVVGHRHRLGRLKELAEARRQ